MHITELSNELIAYVLEYIHNIEHVFKFMITCKYYYDMRNDMYYWRGITKEFTKFDDMLFRFHITINVYCAKIHPNVYAYGYRPCEKITIKTFLNNSIGDILEKCPYGPPKYNIFMKGNEKDYRHIIYKNNNLFAYKRQGILDVDCIISKYLIKNKPEILLFANIKSKINYNCKYLLFDSKMKPNYEYYLLYN